MMHLKNLLKQPLQVVPIKIILVLFVLAILGFVDSSYLTIEHFRNAIPPCTNSGCETVLISGYSSIFSIPVALLGMIYYLVISIGLFSYIESKFEPLLRSVLSFTIVGFVMSMWFVFAQAFLIHAYCLYCLSSATISTILFITAFYVLKKYRKIDLIILKK